LENDVCLIRRVTTACFQLLGAKSSVKEQFTNFVMERSKILENYWILFVKKELNLFVIDLSSLLWGKTFSGLRCKMRFSSFHNLFESSELLLTTSAHKLPFAFLMIALYLLISRRSFDILKRMVFFLQVVSACLRNCLAS